MNTLRLILRNLFHFRAPASPWRRGWRWRRPSWPGADGRRQRQGQPRRPGRTAPRQDRLRAGRRPPVQDSLAARVAARQVLDCAAVRGRPALILTGGASAGDGDDRRGPATCRSPRCEAGVDRAEAAWVPSGRPTASSTANGRRPRLGAAPPARGRGRVHLPLAGRGAARGGRARRDGSKGLASRHSLRRRAADRDRVPVQPGRRAAGAAERVARPAGLQAAVGQKGRANVLLVHDRGRQGRVDAAGGGAVDAAARPST